MLGSRRTDTTHLTTTRSIPDIFRYIPWKSTTPTNTQRKSSNFSNFIPPRNASLPLTLYFHAERRVFRSVQKLKAAQHKPSFEKRHEKVHEDQRALLEAIYELYDRIDEDLKIPKVHRAQLPPEDQRELESTFSENIFFAAQALCAGFRVRGIEHYTEDLIQPARELCATFDALRYVLHLRIQQSFFPPYNDLNTVIIDFDKAWTVFEEKICQCYYIVTYHGPPARCEELDLFQVIMSETISDAIQRNLISRNQIQDYDPSLMFTLPRLTILSALLMNPEILDITNPHCRLRWFRDRTKELTALRQRLRDMSITDLHALECHLVQRASDTVSLDDKAAFEDVRVMFRGICNIADELHSGVWAPELSSFMQRVFEMFTEVDRECREGKQVCLE